MVFWNVTPCRWGNRYHVFGDISRPLLHGWNTNLKKNVSGSFKRFLPSYRKAHPSNKSPKYLSSVKSSESEQFQIRFRRNGRNFATMSHKMQHSIAGCALSKRAKLRHNIKCIEEEENPWPWRALFSITRSCKPQNADHLPLHPYWLRTLTPQSTSSYLTMAQ